MVHPGMKRAVAAAVKSYTLDSERSHSACLWRSRYRSALLGLCAISAPRFGFAHVCVCVVVCVVVRVCVCIYIYIYIFLCVCVWLFVYIYINIYIYIYI